MIHDNPLNKVVERHGLVPLAQAIGVSYQAVQRYIKDRVPAEKVIALCAADGWEVTPHQLRPDLYPHPDDGLPREYADNHDGSLGRRSNDRRHRTVIINNSPEKPDSSA